MRRSVRDALGAVVPEAVKSTPAVNQIYLTKENGAKFTLLRHGDPKENRTPVTAVKGRCLNRLTMGPARELLSHMPG